MQSMQRRGRDSSEFNMQLAALFRSQPKLYVCDLNGWSTTSSAYANSPKSSLNKALCQKVHENLSSDTRPFFIWLKALVSFHKCGDLCLNSAQNHAIHRILRISWFPQLQVLNLIPIAVIFSKSNASNRQTLNTKEISFRLNSLVSMHKAAESDTSNLPRQCYYISSYIFTCTYAQPKQDLFIFPVVALGGAGIFITLQYYVR